MAVSTLMGVDSAQADTRYQYIEMADGAFARFEIQSEDTNHLHTGPDKAGKSSAMETADMVPRQSVDIVEMADGRYVTFPKSKKEVDPKGQTSTKVSRSAEMNTVDICQETDVNVEVIEMVDGRMVAFAVKEGRSRSDQRTSGFPGDGQC